MHCRLLALPTAGAGSFCRAIVSTGRLMRTNQFAKLYEVGEKHRHWVAGCLTRFPGRTVEDSGVHAVAALEAGRARRAGRVLLALQRVQRTLKALARHLPRRTALGQACGVRMRKCGLSVSTV